MNTANRGLLSRGGDAACRSMAELSHFQWKGNRKVPRKFGPWAMPIMGVNASSFAGVLKGLMRVGPP